MRELGVPAFTSATLVGREAETALLDRGLTQAALGHPGTIVITGEAGVGKSRLVGNLLAEAGARGYRGVSGTCLEFGRTIPFLPFTEIFHALDDELDARDRESILGSAKGLIDWLAPQAGATHLPPASVPAGDSESTTAASMGRVRSFERVLSVVEKLAAQRPTVFVLEDVQWADHSSLELATYVARNLRNERALFIVTARREAIAPASPMARFLSDLERSRSAQRIELDPLSPAEMARQASAIIGHRLEPAALATLHAQSGGNPLFAEELLAASASKARDRLGPLGSDDLSPRLRDLVSARTADLPPEAREVLRVAAAAGRIVDDGLVADASGLPASTVAAGLRAAIAAQILVRTPATEERSMGYRFRHELLREVVAAELLPGERARLHAAFANALVARLGAPAVSGELAFHWDAAGNAARAIGAHVEAGLMAERLFAFGEAHEHYERAMVLWPRVAHPEEQAGVGRRELSERAAHAAGLAGDHRRAVELSRSLLAELDPVTEPDDVFRVRSYLRWSLWESGDHATALASAEDEVRGTPGGKVGVAQANALGHLAGLLLFAGKSRRAEREARKALAMAQAIGAHTEEVVARVILGRCLIEAGRADAGLEEIRVALEIAGEFGDPAAIAIIDHQLASALEVAGRLDGALGAARHGLDISARHGLERTHGAILAADAARALRQLGRWAEAEAVIATTLDSAPLEAGHVALLVERAMLAVERGQFGAAAEAIDEVLDSTAESTSLDHVGWLTVARVELALWQDQPREARAVVAATVRVRDEGSGLIWSELGASGGRLLWLLAWAMADVSLARRAAGLASPVGDAPDDAEVVALLGRVRRKADRAGTRSTELRLMEAEVERGRNPGSASAVRSWTAAAAAATAAGRPYREAYARWRLAEALVAMRGDRDRAIGEARAAARIAGRLGAEPLARAITLLARRARLTLEDAPVEGPDHPAPGRTLDLTDREMQVLSLLATGRSNREIAGRLFISPKTASVHVSHILDKLGVEGRVEAATIAQRMGLVAADDTHRAEVDRASSGR